MIKIALSRLIDDYPKIKDLSLSLHYLQKKKKIIIIIIIIIIEIDKRNFQGKHWLI